MMKMNTTICSFSSLILVMLLGWSVNAQAQTGGIEGNIVNASTEEPLPGVNVVIEELEQGTASGPQGDFEIDNIEPGTYTIVASFVGFERHEETVEIQAGETLEYNIALQEEAISGDEVVVVGYGTQEQTDVTGSISRISDEDIQEVPISDAGQALQGRTAGVVALSSGGRPGQGMTIRVRGRRSLSASNDPLFVVDGIPLEGDIDDINPRDIESMEVLKDASATAIYGSRGANGVVLVTTKRGGDYATTVSYSGQSGISEVIGTPDMMSGSEFATMKELGGRSFTGAEEEALEQGVSTDWADLVLENGYQHNHQLSVRGGDESTRFAISANFFEEGGVIKNQDFNRNTFRINLDHNINDRFRVGTSTQISNRVQNWGSNPYGQALAATPLAEPYDENGELILRPGADPLVFNPLADLKEGAYIDERSRLRVFSNIFADLDIHDNLNYRMNFGPDFREYRRGLFQGSETTVQQFADPYAEKEDVRSIRYTFENILTYSQDFGQIHSLDLTGLFSMENSNTEWTNAQANQLPYETQKFHNLGSANEVSGIGSSLEEWGLMSFMGRLNYQLMDRYLFTLTGRYDGSSRLAEGNKWGFFPSGAFAWRITEEEFMADQTLFSDLRLRVSYGKTGNTAIDPYQTQGGLTRTIYAFGDNSGYGYRPGSIANPELQWEVSTTANLGLEFGLLEDRLSGSFEVYQTNTEDLLLERNIPITSGFNSVLENIGETQNRGFEFSLSSRNVTSTNFSWSTDLNLYGNREEIVDLYGTGEDDVGNEWFVGEPLTVWYDYDKEGIWQEDEASEAAQFDQEPGEIKVRDVNDDGQINEQDRVIRGSDMPLISAGMTNRFNYRGFDLSVQLFGSFGQTIYNQFEVNNSTMQGRYNNLDVDYWTQDNPTNNHPKPDGSREFPLYSSSRGYMPGDFVKIRNIQFGYNLPATFLENSLGMRSMRIYANAETPFIFSRLDRGLDPEEYGGVIDSDIPTTRLYTVGIDINF